ncbi:MAG: SDR family oxidoreductase [Pyrinomonadaceae bacterium]|nr:SDR family oxidoreductase [Pyrinomonadaceae bacterium]
MKLTNRVALITGGGRGIGRAIALAFAREGARIAVLARTTEQVAQVAAEIESEGAVEAMHAECDVSLKESVEHAVGSVMERFGRVDILVNNAGIAESAPLHRTSDELWERHININLNGTFYCTRAALPSMIESGWGRVINIASIAGKTGAAYISAYTASKHGVVGLTRSLAMEVAAKGITVNAICPGYVETEMAAHAIENITTKTGKSETEARDMLNRMSPQNRLVTPEEVAALALLLASEDGRGINGQAINIDGGSVLS